jgi:hypothetical protein
MSSDLPFDIIAQIIYIVGENKDTTLLKDLALVSHSFMQICSKHLFATVELHDAIPRDGVASSKKGFIKLLTSRPDVVKYIRKLSYEVSFITFNYYDSHPPIQVYKRSERRSSDLTHPSKFPSIIFSSHLRHSHRFKIVGMEYPELFHKISAPLPHASSYH